MGLEESETEKGFAVDAMDSGSGQSLRPSVVVGGGVRT